LDLYWHNGNGNMKKKNVYEGKYWNPYMKLEKSK